MSEKKRIMFGHIFEYASSQYISQFIGFFIATFIRRFLGPVNTGIWSLMKVIFNYTRFANLGTENALEYKYPYLKGKGDKEELENVKNVVFSYIMLISALTFIGLILAAFFLRHKYEKEIIAGIITVAVMVIVHRSYTYYVMLLRANKDFSVLSKSIIFDAFVNLILVMIVVGKFGLYGLYVVLVIMPILNVVYIRHYVSYNLKYIFKLDKLISYIKFSFPLFISGILNILLTSVDSIMIAKMLDLKQLGYYSIGTMARSYSVGLSRNFNIVIAPHFLEDYGKAQDIQKVSKYLRIPALASSITMALLLGIGYFLIPLFVNLFLPQFKPGILAAQLFLLATYFEIASPQSDNFLVANNKQSKLMYIVGLALTFNIIFNYIYIKLGLGITGVTLATVISSFISFSIMLLYAASLFEHKLSKITSVYLITLIPLIYSLLILFILERFILINDVYLSALIKILLFTTAFIPFLWHLNRKTEIMKILFSYIGNKIRFK